MSTRPPNQSDNVEQPKYSPRAQVSRNKRNILDLKGHRTVMNACFAQKVVLATNSAVIAVLMEKGHFVQSLECQSFFGVDR